MMLEPETARRYLDPSLQVDCDLSKISFLATANSLDPLPSPLRDRMRAISVPEPAAADLDALLSLVMNDVACERGRAAAWVEPLDGTARGLIAANWPGGSLRQVWRLVETIMIAREVGRTMHSDVRALGEPAPSSEDRHDTGSTLGFMRHPISVSTKRPAVPSSKHHR